MTETSYHYGAKQPLPVASPPTYLLLIDSRVSNYQDIINAKQPGVYHIVFEAPTRPTRSTKLIKDIEEKIAALGVGAFTSIGLVQHNDEKPVYEMFGRTSDIIKPRIRAVERDDPYFQSWNSVALFITMLRQNYGIEYFDMMACALYSNPDWKYIIDKLTTLTGVTVRASTDDTGAASLGGDWFLESHTGVNLKSTYFTDAIESYNGLLYTAPSPPPTASTKKLILIDHRIKDIDVIINAMNDDTYCLVFNYFYDTPASILSKLRFLNSNNRYILDHFHYETPEIPTQMDASGNQCSPCDDFDIADIQLLPGTLQNEYLEYTTSAAANDASGNGGVWPFHSESTNITINKPVFFQRSKIGETTESVVYPSTEISTVILNYKPRPMVLVSDLDEFYVLGQDVGEIVGDALAFECVGIIQHTVDPYIGYKFIGGGDDSVSPAIIQDVASRDASLSTWAAFAGVIQSLKTAHQTTTLDMMACALYANPDWKYIIDNLAVRENITIRASLDNTGSALDEGNWVLETDNVSLTTVYFTDKIYAWKYVLATYIDTRFNALRWNNPIETDNHTGMHASRAYDSRLKIAAGTNNFTIEAWYYETAARTNSTIVDMGNYNYLFQIRTSFGSSLNFYNNASNWMHASSASLTPGQWNHVAITRSGSTFTFYVNGIARQTFTNSASLQSNDSTFAIGMQSPDTCACNKMKLDSVLYDIRLWSVARTADQIRMNRNRVVPANSTGLVANYLCTDNGGNFNDRTTNALHTTLQSYDASRWSNSTVTIPNMGFLISNNYSLRTSNSGTALNALTHFDNITHTDFSGVDLSGVNFRGADLTGCNFTNANLTNTDFTNATVLNITTTNAITTGSNLSQAITNMSAETVLSLDGVDDAVNLGIPSWSYSPLFRTAMTVECWFKTADTNNLKIYTTLVSRNSTGGSSGNSQFSIYMLSTGEVGFGLTNASDTGSYHNTTQTYKDTLWHHAAFTYNSSSGVKRIYIDGALSRSDSVPSGFGLLSNNTFQRLVIGSDDYAIVANSADRQFRGSMSDVRIWNVERSANQIADNYRSRLIGNESGLVGYWKLNQGRIIQGVTSGWGSYSAVMDSTTSRTHGSIVGAGATPSGSWVVSNLKFQPRVSSLTLGANNGVYNFSDSSFSFIDPSSNSLGNFSYSVSPSSVATITNGAATMKTIYSLAGAITIPTYTLYEFPVLADLASWQIDISFTVTGNAGTWRALIGDMYNNVNTGRGWGLWVSASNRIHWSWIGTTAEPGTISVSLNTPYVLTAAQSSGTITLTLRTVSTGATPQTGSFSVGANVIGRGPVSIGGWHNYAGENFPGTISYVNVSVPTNQRLVSFSSVTDAGTPATVTAIQDSSFDFGAGSQTASLTVSKSNPTIGTLTAPAKNFGDASFNLTAPTSNSDGAFTYSSSNTAVATVTSDGTVTIVGAGSTTITASQAASADGNYNSGSVTASLVVSPIAPTIGSLSVPAKNFGDAQFNLTAPTSNSGGAFTYSSSNTAIATVTSGGTVTIVGAGSTTITASQAASADGNYNSGSVSASLVVSPIAPTIGSLSVPAKNFGDASFNLTAPTSNSSGAFTYSSSNTAVATVTSGGTVTIVGAGSTTITASQAASADGNYNSGSVSASLVVSPIAPTIGSLSVPAKNFGDAQFNLTAPTSNSSGAFTYSSSNTAVATVTSGGTVTIVGAGSTTITASQAASADGNYNSGSVSASLVVSPIAPTIGSLSVPAKNFGDASFNLTAPTSDSSGVFTYSSSNTAVATVTSGGTVTIVGAGSTTITASQAASADGNYNSGSVTASLVVSPIAPTIGSLSVSAKNFGDAQFNLTAPTSNSSGAFTYSSSNTAVATVTSDGTVTIVGAGSTTITASQAASADGNYNSGSVTASLVVSPINPTIGTLTAPAKNFGDASFNLTAPTSNSDGAFTYSSSNTAVATVTSGGTVTIVGAGSTTITASQAASADGNYNSGSVSASLVVSPIAPTIGSLSVPAKNFGDASFNLTAPTSNSGGAFTYSSSNTAVATVTSGGTVTIVGAGSTTITASQAASADGNYNSGSVSASLVVSPIAPTIGSLSVPAKNFGDAQFNLTAPTSNSSGVFTYSSSNTAVATVTSDGTVTIVGAGSTTITATQAASADGNYNSGSVTSSLVVSPIAPTIGSLSVPAKNFGDASFNLTAPTSDSSGVFTYSSSNTAVATVTSGGIVIIVAAGSTTITASQAASADGNYNSGSVTASLVVSPIAPTIGSLSVPAKNFGDASFNLTAPTSDSSGAFTYSSSNTGVATVTTGGTVSIVGAGSTTITANQAASADGNYTGGSTVSASLVVSPIAPTITSFSIPSKNFRDASFNLTAPSSNSSGAFTYDISNTAVATVTSGGVVTIVGAGTTNITATQAASADGNYTAGSSITAALVVSAVAPNIGALSVPAKNFGDASFNLTAPTSDSNGAFSYTSSNELVATVALVDGVGVITVVGAGSTTITATQAASADGNYTGGSSVSASLVVSPIAPTYQSISQITKTYSTDVSFSLLAVMSGVSNSDGAYSFSTASNAISIVNGIATILAYTPSAITITASQDASGNYTASTKTMTLLVSRKTPSYGEFSIPSKTFGDASFSIAPYAPTTDSTEVPFTYTSSDLNVATINSSGTDITIIGQGYTTITASQEASGNYAANSITTSFLVNRAAPTFLKAFTIPNKTFGDASFSLLPFTDGLDNTDGTYHFTSSNSELVSISAVDGVTATIHAYTPTPITIYVAIDACGNYAASSTSGTLTVLRAAPTIGALSVPATKNFGDASFNISAPSSNSSGAFTYTSSNTAVATVSEPDNGGVATVTVVGAGSTTITATQATNGNYTSGSVSASIVVSPIAPTIGTLTAPAKNFGDASFNLTAPSSNSDGSFTYTSSNTAVATVSSDGTVSVVGAGSTTITATQAASSDGNYTGGSSVSASLVVSAIAPTIGSLSVPAKNFGDASFNLTAPTSDSSGAFSYTSSDTSVATVSNSGGVGTVTVVGAGTTTITATQAASADGNYTGGSSVSASLVVSPIAPTIGTLSVPAKNFGDASFNITAPSSNSSGAFTYTSSNTSVATVSNSGGVGTVTIVGAGSTTITATQASSSDGNYTGGSSVSASLVVSPIAPTIGALSVPAKNFGDASFNLTAPTSNSGGAFTYTSSNPSVASVTTDGIVTIVAVGTTTITATQAAIVNGNYLTGSVTASLVVSAIAPTIGALSVPAKNFGDASFNLTAPSSNSGGAFTYTSSNTSVATVTSGGTVTVVGAGSTTITATQAASSDGNYTGGSSVSASLVVSAIAPTIGALSVPAKNFGDASFNLTAPSSNSGGAFTYTSSSTAVATVTSGGTVTVVGAGSTTITATQAASSDGNYTGGSSVSASLVVSPIAPTIGALSVPAKNFGDASFNLTAPTSNNIGAFTYTSSNPSVASVTTDGIVTIVAAGTTTITATQAATTNYNSGSVSASLVVSAIAPTIGSLSVPAKNFGDASFNLTAPTSNSDGAFTYSSSNTAVATVSSGGTVTVVGAGSTTITATQAASSDGNYTGGSSVSASLVVSAIAPTIGSLSVPAKNFGDASFNLTAPSSNSGGAFTYTSSNTSVATVSLVGVVTVVGAGSTTITATQAASSDGNYTGGSSVSTSLVVSSVAPNIGTLSIPAKNFGDASFNLTAPSSNSGGAFTYTSSNTSVATVTSGGTVTVVGAGTTTITATQAATTNYNIGSVSASLVVSAIAPTIGTLSVPAKNFGESEFNITAPSSNSGGAFTYTSSNTAVATVSNVGGVGTVTIVSAGTTTITAIQAATTNYTSGSVSASLVVSPIAPTIGALAVSDKNVSDPSFNLTAPTSNSSGAFTYSSSNTGVATVSNAGGVGTVSIVGVGTTTITATQAASSDGNYSGGSSVSATLTVSAELSNFTVPSNKKYGDASFDLTDPTSIYSDEPFTFSSSNPTVASIGGVDGRTVSIHLAGSTVITATQAATGAHGELSISATLIISKKTPVITVAAGSIAKNYGNASFNIALPSSTNTDAGGGGGGAFSYSSRNTSIVSIIDTSYVSITGVGSTIIDVTQSATANFTEAVSTISITVSKGTPVLSAFTVAANKTYGSAPFSALAYPSSASAGSFTYSSSDTSVATIDSSTGVITLLAAGYVNFTATQAATDLYNSASKTSNTMTVHRQILPLVRSSPITEVINKTYGDSYFNVVASNASNGGTITYETDNPSVAGIVGLATAGIISVVTVGTATITARRGDTPQYSSHPVSWTVEVGRTTTTLTGLSDLSYNVTAAPFSVSASSASDGAVSYSLQDPSSNVLTIHPTTGLVTLRAPGSAVIVASQAQGTLYLSPASITATITVSSAGNALQGATITNTSSFESVNLSGASLAGVSITNTTFASANLSGSNMTNAVITNANFGNADLSGATLTGAIITGATFTAVSLKNADLSGAIVSNTVFTGADLSGARLTRVDASGSSFANASLSNVDLTGANITNTNFTNTNIKGANITDVSFSDVQKLQLLKNSENREIPQVILTEVPGTTVLAVVSESSPLRSVANLNLASSTLKVIIPHTSPSPTTVIQNIEIDVNSGSTRFYLPINESEYFQIQDIKYYASAGVVRNYATNAVVEVIYYSGTPIWLFAGSIVGLILQANTLNSSSFVVPRVVTLGTLTPFMPTTLPTSNSNAPIVYSSSHPAIASIDASSGLITVAGTHTGEVVFTATQAQNVTHEPGVCLSNRMFVSNILNFSLIGLNQAFDLSTMATLDASSVNLDATDATAIFYVRLSDMLNVFKYQSDAFDVNNIGAQDIKYFVFHRNWPSELRINPSHAMMDQLDSLNMLGSGFSADKSLTKHDFIRHIALSLFNTIHGVDLFSNEEDLLENSVYLGETVRHNIDGILSNISTTSASEGMAYDASGNKYLTNDASGNTNLCRELMRQVAASSPLRFYNNGGNNPGIKTVPFHENDTIQFKLVMQAAIQQNLLTGVSEIPTRSYTIKLILKNTVSPFANTNTTVGDSEMYPNAFPYSTSVATYAPTADSSGVYNIYSPPAPIPFSRYGYNGWYYTNSTAWVNVEPAVRNHVKWLVGANTGSSKVGDLQYIRFNLKIHNKSALPYLMIYTDAGSSRKYPVAGGSASLTNGELYSFYMNFNSYAREPAVIGHTNAALAYTIGSGAFANTEGILNIALETDSNAAAGNVEFTLMSIVIGELSTATGATTEREYGFQAAVLDSYP